MLKLDIKKQLYGAGGHMDLAVNLCIEKGEFVALMGQSGSGKTTLLRVLAGLETTQGDIVVEGKSWHDVSPQQREIGFVFQDYALFENMTVEENLLFVDDDVKLATKLLEMTELTALKKRNVQILSGGQKQRVSLCRAMMKKPKILLLDEPLSALDVQMRSKLQQEIKQLHKSFEITTIIVSHELREVYALADRVLVLEQGKIIQDGNLDKVLGSKKNGHYVEVLKIQNHKATVYIAGEFLEVDVQENVQVGERIEVVLNPQTLH
ncbi:MAG TPA: ATP-binding cassette domain-containing protein [Epsilonproteobacteria bacterium]|nr:ATP-binding cassette domain-containing protein [Campylobacterota bacterium]